MESTKPSLHTYLGVFLISCAVLSVQICLTRLFSVIIWYHFGFFVISVALLGFSAAGVYLALRDRATTDPPSIALHSLIFGLLVALGLGMSLNLPFNMSALQQGRPAQWIYLGLILLATSLPYFFGGMVIVGALTQFRDHVNRVYFTNLLGSGIGCLAAVILLDHLGGPAALLASAALACLAAAALKWGHRAGRTGYRTSVALFVLLLLAAGAVSAFPRHLPWLTVNSSKAYEGKPLSEVELRRWNSSSMVDFFPAQSVGLWEPSPRYSIEPGNPEPPLTKGINIDSWAWTSIINHVPERWDRLKIYDYLATTIFYKAKVPENLLVIGPGGGTDVLAGLYFGAKHIDAVEINPILVEAVRDTFADWAGRIYDDPRVSAYCAEGRHFLERSDSVYDTIQLSGIDTFAASQAGAFALSENYLYTREAFDLYFRRLESDGYLVMMRWLYKPRRQSLRMFVTAWEALARAGAPDPGRNIFLISNSPHIAVGGKIHYRQPYFSVMVAKRTAFTREEADALTDASRTLNFPILFRPDDRNLDNPFTRFARAPDKAEFKRAYTFNVEPSTDENPFFFENAKWANIFKRSTVQGDVIFAWFSGQMVLLITLAVLTVVGAGLLLLPLVRRRWIREQARSGIAILPFFACLGLGFILLEIGLMQRFTLFLGRPVYALSVVLFSLLVFSGLGSFAASGFRHRPYLGIGTGTVLVALIALAYREWLPAVFDATLEQPDAVRVLLAVGLLAPLGFLMGMPFPSGIRAIAAEPRGVVAWAWALNGFLSVVGSVVAVMLAMTWGFGAVQGIAALVYLAALAVAVLYRRRSRRVGETAG